MGNVLEIDGSFGEGGGQVLRTALAMSMVTGKPFRITRIRAGRKKPGLLHQHLTSVRAAAQISAAEVTSAELGSQELAFTPRAIKAGEFHFAVETAGSCTLVLQTVLPALLTADGRSELVLEGGTHNPFAPPFDFLAKTFLPVLNRMGPTVTALLERPGFYPAGGGKITVSVEPAARLIHLQLKERGEIRRCRARAVIARLSPKIADRELAVIGSALGWKGDCLTAEEITNSRGPGNVVIIEVESKHITEVFTGFGQRGVPAEQVAERTVKEVREYTDANVPVGNHLADQLLIPMAIACGGRFRTLPPTEHTRTNMEIIKQFLDIEVMISQLDGDVWEIEIKTR